MTSSAGSGVAGVTATSLIESVYTFCHQTGCNYQNPAFPVSNKLTCKWHDDELRISKGSVAVSNRFRRPMWRQEVLSWFMQMQFGRGWWIIHTTIETNHIRASYKSLHLLCEMVVLLMKNYVTIPPLLFVYIFKASKVYRDLTKDEFKIDLYYYQFLGSWAFCIVIWISSTVREN